jgi:hypothetical protein
MDDFSLAISGFVAEKLRLIHGVSILELEEAFNGWVGCPVVDSREHHRTKPPTIWFIATTGEGRLLKIVGIPNPPKKQLVIKSAFDADHREISIYEDHQ